MRKNTAREGGNGRPPTRPNTTPARHSPPAAAAAVMLLHRT